MEDKYPKKTYKQLLKDNTFLQWRFTPTSETDNYWTELMENDSELASEIKKADRYLKKKFFNISSLPSEDEDLLLKRILASLQKKSSYKKRIIPIWRQFSIAASIAVIIAIGSILFFNRKSEVKVEKDVIVGKELISENIQLISNNKTTSFQENIDIEIDADGLAQVKTTDKDNEEIAVNVSDVNTLIVPYGKRSTLTLADGSKVWLNSGSMLEFPTQFSADNREIRLKSGEMYIEVAPDKKKSFYVHTDDLNVQVLGTKFNISTYDNMAKSVALLEGSVQLASGDESVKLNPNELAIMAEPGKFSTQSANVAELITWKDGYLLFKKTPISDVLTTLSRHYNISFSFEKDINLKRRTCSGKLFLSNDIDDVMKTIALLSLTQYTREDNKIYITNKNNL